MEEIVADPCSWHLFARNYPPSFLEENYFRVMWPNDEHEELWLPLTCVSPRPFRNSMWCCDVLIVDKDPLHWRLSGAAALVREIPFATGAHLLLVWDTFDFQHDIQDPGWQRSGTKGLSERRWRPGSLKTDHWLRGRCRPRALGGSFCVSADISYLEKLKEIENSYKRLRILRF